MNATTPARMARLNEPGGTFDFFPAPPWATRALIEEVLIPLDPRGRRPGGRFGHKVWEPAAGDGRMARVLEEYFEEVHATDIALRPPVSGFLLREKLDFLTGDAEFSCDWIITNPPFNTAKNFALKALVGLRNRPTEGVAFLVRLSWVTSRDRYVNLFSRYPPSIVAPFSEHVSMSKDRHPDKEDGPSASTFAWFVWYTRSNPPTPPLQTQLHFIPPCREHLEKPDFDYEDDD